MSEITATVGTESGAAESAATDSSWESAWDGLNLADCVVQDDAAEEGAETDGTKVDGAKTAGTETAPDTGKTAEGKPADQSESGKAAGKENAADKPAATADGKGKADQLFTLRRFGETKEVGKDEMIALAQKGWDYENIRTERDTAREENKRLAEYETFLKELADPQHLSIDDLIDSTHAKLLAQKEKLDESVALGRVKNERERKAIETEKQKATADARQKADAEKKRQDDFAAFIKARPDVDPKTIPAEVWDAVKEGDGLANAYTRHESKTLRSQVEELARKLEAAEQNAKNATRAAGSRKDAGRSSSSDDWASYFK